MQWGGGGGRWLRRHRQRRGGHRHRPGRMRRRLPSPRPGPVRPLRSGPAQPHRVGGAAAHTLPYGLMSAAQMFAMKANRFMHDHGVDQEALRAISLASLRARPAQPAGGDVRPAARRGDLRRVRAGSSSRSTSTTAARRTTARPPWSSSPPSGPRTSPTRRATCSAPCRARSTAPARRCTTRPTTPRRASRRWRPGCTTMAEVGPADVDVLQSYENFTGGVMMSIVEHGFCTPRRGQRASSPSRTSLAPTGKLPLNTSGGNLAECYMHGLGLNIEAVRQIWGESTSPGPRRRRLDGLLRPRW